MRDFRVGYLYSLSPIHCGGEGDLGNILEIVREAHTNFPYVPGSSLRGSLRNEVEILDSNAANTLFGKELDSQGQMGVHQVWFGDARLLWIPMRTMSLQGIGDIFTWVSCHSLIRAHAISTGQANGFVVFPDHPVGTRTGTYWVADSKITVSSLSNEQKKVLALAGNFPDSLKNSVKPVLEKNCIIFPDEDFEVLMEHSLWTQIRNKIQEGTAQAGSAGFWTDVCISRDTILYFNWGYSLLKETPVTEEQHQLLMTVLQGLIQIGGQANVGRGWVQSWVNKTEFVVTQSQQNQPAAEVSHG